MDADVLTFGPWLQRRRHALHLTQQQLGRLAGCAAEIIRLRRIQVDTLMPLIEEAMRRSQ
jgi:transcriptional regulator with XRE-family HTH domain